MIKRFINWASINSDYIDYILPVLIVISIVSSLSCAIWLAALLGAPAKAQREQTEKTQVIYCRE